MSLTREQIETCREAMKYHRKAGCGLQEDVTDALCDLALSAASETRFAQSLPSSPADWKGPYVQPRTSGDLPSNQRGMMVCICKKELWPKPEGAYCDECPNKPSAASAMSADELDSIAENELSMFPSAARIARNVATMLRSSAPSAGELTELQREARDYLHNSQQFADDISSMPDPQKRRFATEILRSARSSEGVATPWIEQELADGDKICEAAGVQRTEGGRLPVAKIINAIKGRPVLPHRSGGSVVPRAEPSFATFPFGLIENAATWLEGYLGVDQSHELYVAAAEHLHGLFARPAAPVTECSECRRLNNRLAKIDAALDELGAPTHEEVDGLTMELSRSGRIKRLVSASGFRVTTAMVEAVNALEGWSGFTLDDLILLVATMRAADSTPRP